MFTPWRAQASRVPSWHDTACLACLFSRHRERGEVAEFPAIVPGQWESLNWAVLSAKWGVRHGINQCLWCECQSLFHNQLLLGLLS